MRKLVIGGLYRHFKGILRQGIDLWSIKSFMMIEEPTSVLMICSSLM